MIFTSFKKITSKWVLKSILIVYSSCFALNLFFYFFFSFPLIRNEIEKQIKNIEINLENKNGIKSEQNETEVLRLKEDKNIQKQLIIKEKISDNNSNINEINKVIEEINDNENKDSIKVCTCIGYLYFQKKIGDKDVCIFYDYTSCCSWFLKKLKKPEIFLPFFIELGMQLNVIGFNPILSDYLLKKFSFTKNIKIFLAFLICVGLINLYILFILPVFQFSEYFKNEKYNFPKIISAILSGLLFGMYSIFTLIFSIVYLVSKNPTGKHYENCIIAELIFFKTADLHMLSFYDFLDDEDCLNTSVIITFERFLWMIVEVIIDCAETNWTILVSIQIGISLILCCLLILFIDKSHNQ